MKNIMNTPRRAFAILSIALALFTLPTLTQSVEAQSFGGGIGRYEVYSVADGNQIVGVAVGSFMSPPGPGRIYAPSAFMAYNQLQGFQNHGWSVGYNQSFQQGSGGGPSWWGWRPILNQHRAANQADYEEFLSNALQEMLELGLILRPQGQSVSFPFEDYEFELGPPQPQD
jgi:hypothetical protein